MVFLSLWYAPADAPLSRFAAADNLLLYPVPDFREAHIGVQHILIETKTPREITPIRVRVQGFQLSNQ